MDLFVTSPLKICAQINLNIRNSLMADIPREHIRILYSHPQVLGQTRNWISGISQTRNSWKRPPPRKPAFLPRRTPPWARHPRLSAGRGIVRPEHPGRRRAGPVLQHHPFCRHRTPGNAAQRQGPHLLLIRIQHKPGTLAEVVNCFQRHNNNLIRIESRPSKVINWEYVFYIDAAGHIQESPLRETLPELEQHCSMLKILGSYADTDVI